MYIKSRFEGFDFNPLILASKLNFRSKFIYSLQQDRKLFFSTFNESIEAIVRLGLTDVTVIKKIKK